MRNQTIFILCIGLMASHMYAQMTVKDTETHVLMQVTDEGTAGSIRMPAGIAPESTSDKLYNVSGQLYWNGSALATSGSAGGWTDDGSVVRLTGGSDQVGIGTASPVGVLTLQNSMATEWNSMLHVYAPGAGSEIHTAGIQFGRGNSANECGVMWFLPSPTSSTDCRMTLGVWGNNDILNIEGTGNVGIGDASPTHRLEIGGKVGINDTTVLYLPDQADFQGTLIVGNGGRHLNHSFSSEGQYNTVIGLGALEDITTGSRNTGIGSQSLYSNTEGWNNTAVGEKTLYSNITGLDNIAVGRNALYNNINGDYNTAVGNSALAGCTGTFNTGLGYNSLLSNTGNSNTAIGTAALQNNTSGNLNTACGRASLAGSAGSENTAVGAEALLSNQGDYNTAVGFQALYNYTQDSTTAVGYQALYNNVSGLGNTALGFRTLYSNATGNGNTAVGRDALKNGDGDYNTALGYSSLLNNASVENTAIGAYTLMNNSSFSNTAVGYRSSYSNTLGVVNSAVGVNSLYSNTTGYQNTAVGSDALYSNTTGTNNTAFGCSALYANTVGSYNTALGYYADVFAVNLTNATAIGYGAVVNASNSVRIGNSSVSLIEGQVAWTSSSDSTKKENFLETDGEEVLDKISRMWLGSWNFKGQDNQNFRHYGPMAQAFYRAFGDDGVGTCGTDTTICASDIDGINMIAIQALEKRSRENGRLREEVAMLKSKLTRMESLVDDLRENMERTVSDR